MEKGDLWVILEYGNKELSDISKELCSQGRRMKKSHSTLVGILVGRDVQELAHRLGRYGVEKTYLVEGEDWGRFNEEAYMDLLSNLIVEKSPSLILFGSTPMGNALAPRLAVRTRGALVTDCVDFKKQGDRWVAVKSIQGNKINAKVTLSADRLQLFTLKPGAFEIEEVAPLQPIEVIPIPFRPSPVRVRTKIIGFIKADPKNSPLEEAEVIIAGGKGFGNLKEFKVLEELGDLMGATVAGSRPAVDLGWLPYERQIGLTGKKISPRLLLVSGISGAFEFVIGIKDSNFIIAINKDPAAPIFKSADAGIIGDHHEILPVLIETLKKVEK